ncbi:mammalian DNA polymerase-like protein, partial [Perilla frutescens var. hirtella]
VNILADMEIWGIGVYMEGCLRARHVLARKLKLLEKEAYTLAGKAFSLSMPADIANILNMLSWGQCVEHMVELRMNEEGGESCTDHYKINARDFFVPTQEDWVLLTADYCQIELRLMAHF